MCCIPFYRKDEVRQDPNWKFTKERIQHSWCTTLYFSLSLRYDQWMWSGSSKFILEAKSETGPPLASFWHRLSEKIHGYLDHPIFNFKTHPSFPISSTELWKFLHYHRLYLWNIDGRCGLLLFLRATSPKPLHHVTRRFLRVMHTTNQQ